MEIDFDKQNAQIESQVKESAALCEKLLIEVAKKIVGQEEVVRGILSAMIAGGHVLLEGLPGLAKTSAIKAFSQVANLSFKRVQFTPDLLPADLIGTQIYDPRKSEFYTKKGPIFANLILADEINRAPAKVQSALLEAMEEFQITIGDNSFKLEQPFLVMATQNPIEQEGTYPLPEAQVDRFLFKLKVGYGSEKDEAEIMQRNAIGFAADLEKTISREDLLKMRQTLGKIYVSEKVRQYIIQIVFSTREPKKYGFADFESLIECGASPRASIALERSARVVALLDGRTYVTPQDVKDVAYNVLRHRIKLSYEAEAENLSVESLIEGILKRVDVP
jgi:MoxR-like ATPase